MLKIILKGSRNLNNKKLRNKFLVARAIPTLA